MDPQHKRESNTKHGFIYLPQTMLLVVTSANNNISHDLLNVITLPLLADVLHHLMITWYSPHQTAAAQHINYISLIHYVSCHLQAYLNIITGMQSLHNIGIQIGLLQLSIWHNTQTLQLHMLRIIRNWRNFLEWLTSWIHIYWRLSLRIHYKLL